MGIAVDAAEKKSTAQIPVDLHRFCRPSDRRPCELV